MDITYIPVLKHREPYPPYATEYKNRTQPLVSIAPVIRQNAQPTGPTNPHRAHSAGLNQRGVLDISKHAPYPSRMQDPPIYEYNTAGSRPSSAKINMGGYNSLLDPHLRDYYVRKFSNIPDPSRDGHRRRPGSASSKSSSSTLRGKQGKNEVIYKIAVTTGERKNAGTDARVYITIKGTKGKLPKQQLTKKAGSANVKKKKTRFKFGKGTTHIFKIIGKDIGDVRSINIEHDGLTRVQGWFLEQVEIVKKTPKTDNEKSWIFICQKWLSLHEGDCMISRELYAKSSSKAEYEITVVTGDTKGAGTDANVFITLFGKSGSTPKLPLKATSKDTFERNRSDIFVIKTQSVGTLKKIRLQHDNSGFGPGWFVDRVVVCDLLHPKKKYYIPCAMWLAKNEGDGAICKDFVGSYDPLAARRTNKYKVRVKTGDKRGAGTDANVSIILFGDAGDSTEQKLDNNRNNFERGKEDEFTIECPSVGVLKRIRIGHDNSGAGPGWYLDKVEVEDLGQSRLYQFPCERWLADDEDDGAISRDLLAGVGPHDAPAGVPYKIHVMTGDVSQAGTSARIYIIMYGGKSGEECSGKIWLDGGNFTRGRTDIFEQEVASMLSPLSRIEIGHDNSGAGPGWHLDRVMVNCPSAGIEQWFVADKWFALDEGDGQIERTLYENLGMRKKRSKLTTWFVWVHTSDLRGAGTDANVHLVAYGKTTGKDPEYRKSDEILLENKGDNFESGQTDKFKIEMIDIGKPYKVRVGHDDAGSFADWHLDYIEMENMSTKKRYTFKCGRWLSKTEEDGSVMREMPAEGEDIKKPQPLVPYKVEVFTGDKRGAGTNANVFLNIFGEQGDTGERPLTKSSTNRDKFERNKVDEFLLEAVTLKKLKRIRIGHDGSGAGDGWFLDKVVVQEMNDKSDPMVFECNRWLDMKEDDGQIVREITAGGAQLLSTTSYHVSVKTGDIRGGGTDADVTLKIFGDKGDTGNLALLSSENSKNKFERARTDLFKIEAKDIGKIEKIRIGHDGSGVGSGWFLDEVSIDIPSQGQNYVFACHRWLDTGEEDGQTVIELEPTHHREGSIPSTDQEPVTKDGDNEGDGDDDVQRIPYEVTVWTGTEKGAGTDANVFIQMYGEYGKSEEFQLRNRTDNFEQGQMDKFKIEANDIGPLLKVRVGHDGAGRFAGWFLDKIQIQRHLIKGSKRRRRGSLGRRKSSFKEIKRGDVGSDSEDERDRRKGTGRGKGKKYYGDSDEDDYRRRRSTRGKYSDESDENIPPSRKKSLAKQKGRRESLDYSDDDRKSPKPKKKGKKSRRDSDDSDYDSSPRRRSVSKRKGQRLSDDDSEDDRRSVKKKGKKSRHASDDEDDRKTNKRKFQRDFDKSKKGRKEKEEKDDDEEETEVYWFVCNRWFAKSEDDGKIVRELLPTDEHGKALDTGLKEVEYTVTVHTGDVSGAGTDANCFINIAGEFGDTGERALVDSENMNKFERNQDDVFKIKAIELGRLKKVKIRHDNKGGGAAWFLGHIEITDNKSKESYFFPCQRWLSTKDDDGQIARELVPVDKSLKKKLSRKDSMAIRNEIALETKAAMTTYHVFVYTGDKFGAGTDSNVYLILFGEQDDTGQVFLKSSKNNTNKFERNQTDEFVVEAVDIGELKKIRIGHDNAGGGGAWYLGNVEIDCPSLGKKWYFPCNRWLAKDEDDGKLERELYPEDNATEDYIPCMPYEITTYTSDVRGAGTDADVYIVLYGLDTCTQQKSLCPNPKERKKRFEKKCVDKFVLELEDVGESIEKIRIGHDGKGMGAGWHLDKVEVRRLSETGKGSETFTFKCNRWLARGEDDDAIERELVPDKVLKETTGKDGKVKRKEVQNKHKLESKKYVVDVYTGDQNHAGTDSNVFIIIYGDRGDSGERKLHKSETHTNKFERGQLDKFNMEAVDLGKIFKIKIRHDNSAMFFPAWFLDKVEITDTAEKDKYVFHCERWLAKNKDDGKIERSLYVKGYDGDMTSSTGTLKSARQFGGSHTSLDSMKSGMSEPFHKSPRLAKRQLEEIPEGPTIPYKVKVVTGDEKDQGTESNVWIKILGTKKKHTGRHYLEHTEKKGFDPGSIETFHIDAVDVNEVRHIEIGHDGHGPGSGWFVKEVEVDMPTKGHNYFFTCKQWLARDKGDGKTTRMFSLQDGDSSVISYKPMVAYDVTVVTKDEKDAGTDCKVIIKVFGDGGTSSDITLNRDASMTFERGQSNKIEGLAFEDIAPLKKLRVSIDGVGTRPDWLLEQINMYCMETGDLTVFKCGKWFSKKREDGKLTRDLVATVRGKEQLKTTSYKLSVKTSDVSGAGTNANVYCILFGENGDTGEFHLKDSETNKSPFENDQTDVFTFQGLLSVGMPTKLRIWHDNKGLGSSWHLTHVIVEDLGRKTKTTFPCNRWLSKKEDDKQICRELLAANLNTPEMKGKMKYEITVTTSDKKDADMMHNAWLILEGEENSSEEFIMENSVKNKICQRDQADVFLMKSNNLGSLEKCMVGAFMRNEKAMGNGKWHCQDITVKNKTTGDKYVFVVKDWIQIAPKVSLKYAKVVNVKEKEESKLSTMRNLGTVKYEVTVVTGDVKSAGTDANVQICLYGTNGDTGKRPLTQSFRNLFERNQTDKFQLEALDLGDLSKLQIEHDNAGWGAGWFLERVEVTNMASNQTWVFPCGKWLDKKKGDGAISRELLPRD